jgi:hypothetical protein
MKTYAVKMSADQMRVDSGREYNPATWSEMIDRYMKYKDVEFYKVEKNDIWQYDRYFVVYTLPEGLRLMNNFSYSSSLTDGGFVSVCIADFDYNPETNEVKPLPENTVIMFTHGFYSEGTGKSVELNNSKEARRWMTERSQKHGIIYTKIHL